MTNIAVAKWWQLAFATALTYHGKVRKRCHLCEINPCQSFDNGHLSHGTHTHWFNQQQYLCQACHQSIIWQSSIFELSLPTQTIKGVASASYGYPLNQVMLEFKNGQQLHHLPVLVHALRQLDRPKGCHATNAVIIRVPTTAARLQARGFDPLGMLTSYLSFYWQIPIFDGVQRVERRHQQGLSRDERLQNVKDAFFLTNNLPVKNIILFDDVVTTGATMTAMAETLQTHGKGLKLFASAILHGY